MIRKNFNPRDKKKPFQKQKDAVEAKPRKYSSRYSKTIKEPPKSINPDEIRLNKYLANNGICSRREADNLITAGLVTINGEVVTQLGTKVKPGDEVKFNGDRIKHEKKVYILMNKPKDYVTTTDDPQARKTVIDLLKNSVKERVYPVGRLDRQTSGVLLLTNDGDLTTRLTHPKYNKKKIYQVTLDKNFKKQDLVEIIHGVPLEDGYIKADAIDFVDPKDKKLVGIEIHSGRNHIVRRIFEHFDYKVVKLDRVYFAGLTKKGLERGSWRHLNEQEIAMLKMSAYE
jgi:23S rRNA pseudouridine2605 synthase